jgi:hypothetical protein
MFFSTQDLVMSSQEMLELMSTSKPVDVGVAEPPDVKHPPPRKWSQPRTKTPSKPSQFLPAVPSPLPSYPSSQPRKRPSSTPVPVRRARKPRFFDEKEADLLAAAVRESRLAEQRREMELKAAMEMWEREAVEESTRLALAAEAEVVHVAQVTTGMNCGFDEFDAEYDDEDLEATMLELAGVI